jgi:hypothetical protein
MRETTGGRSGRGKLWLTSALFVLFAVVALAGCGGSDSGAGADDSGSERSAAGETSKPTYNIDTSDRTTCIVNGLDAPMVVDRIIADSGPKSQSLASGEKGCWSGYSRIPGNPSVCVDVKVLDQIVRVRSEVTLNNMTVNLPNRCEKSDGLQWFSATVPSRSALKIIELPDTAKLCLDRTSVTNLTATFAKANYYELMLPPSNWSCPASTS